MVVTLFILISGVELSTACSIFVITPGANTEGSMVVGHTNDGNGPGVVGNESSEEFTRLVYTPPADHPPGSVRVVHFDAKAGAIFPGADKSTIPGAPDGYGNEEGIASIPEVPHTYGYLTAAYGIMNEHQLLCSEATVSSKTLPDFDPGRRILYLI